MENRLALGTVQFGLEYGIANKDGRIAEHNAFEILEFARHSGINTLDTAYSYGGSECVLGKFISSRQKTNYKIVSKMPDWKARDSADARKCLLETLARLNQDRIYGYLVHKFDNILTHTDLFEELRSLKKEGLTEKVGLSIYGTEELEYLFDNDINPDIIQIPYSVFDQRFKRYFPVLKGKGVEVHARSVFLQGLVFCRNEDLSGNLAKAGPYLEKLRKLSEESNIPVEALCLNFALLSIDIDKVIIGIDSLAQLRKNLENVIFMKKTEDIIGELEKLSVSDEDIILPYKWSVK